MIRIFFLLLTFALCSNSLMAQQQTFSQVFTEFLDDEDLASATVGFCLVKAENRHEMFSYAKTRTMIPASALKVVTASTVLNIYGPEHRFETQLALVGQIDSGTLNGDVIIVGGGDPTLLSKHFPVYNADILQRWSQALKEHGIQHISGDIIGYSGYFDNGSLSGSTAVADAGNYYGAGAHGLAYRDNSYQLEFQTSAEGTKARITSIQPPIHQLDIRSEVVASKGKSDNAYIYGVPGTSERVVRGELPMMQKSFTIEGSIPNPALQLAFELKQQLLSDEVKVSGEAKSASQEELQLENLRLRIVDKVQSPELSDIVAVTLRKSINTYADALLKHIGVKYYGEGSYIKGIRALRAFWGERGVPTEGWFQEDGSGLSRANGITAQQLALIVAKTNAPFKGHLQKGMKHLGKSKRIRCKSGYMNRVRSYAGYVTMADGTECAFSIIVNNHSCSATEMRKRITTMLEKMSLATS